jgi:lipoprotein-anchoring transpeptidase ErfK/SrfK
LEGDSSLRLWITLSVVAVGLAAFVGEALAQNYPPPPNGGYRAAPMPDDDDDDTDGPPGIFSRPPGAVPNAPARGPYHYGPPEPYDPRSEMRDANSNSGLPPRNGYNGPIESAPLPPGAYSARPDNRMNPPAPDIGATQGPVNLSPSGSATIASLPPEDQPEEGEIKALPPNLQRQLVSYPSTEPAGTLVVDTPHTYLYLVLGGGKALRYGIGVGREGFTWTGVERISRMAEWPDWIPPKEMIERQPYLPRFMAGGPTNPLGARALYLGNSLYRIHGTNQPSTIGTFVSSGCIRLVNSDIEDLYRRVQVGTRVVVMPGSPPASASAAAQAH